MPVSTLMNRWKKMELRTKVNKSIFITCKMFMQIYLQFKKIEHLNRIKFFNIIH